MKPPPRGNCCTSSKRGHVRSPAEHMTQCLFTQCLFTQCLFTTDRLLPSLQADSADRQGEAREQRVDRSDGWEACDKA